jgi:hypothetical protein
MVVGRSNGVASSKCYGPNQKAPMGQARLVTESLTVRKGVKGEETFAKVRRFVVVKPMKGHCICLSVSPVLDELENSICSILLQAYLDI